MHIGILKTDAVRPEWASQFGEYPDMFQRLFLAIDPALSFTTWDVECGELPEDINCVDGYVITGSKSSVYDDKDWIRQAEVFIRALHAQQCKLVGICFGHQLVAQALGGVVDKSSNGWGVGIQEYQLLYSPEQGRDLVRLVASHQDQVMLIPPGAEITARNAHCPIAGFRIDNHILTFQGHPEFIPEYAREIIGFRRPMIGEARADEGLATLATREQEGPWVAQWILDFLRG